MNLLMLKMICFLNLTILQINLNIKFSYDKTWWLECCLDDDSEIIYGDVELVDKACFPEIPGFDEIVLPPLLLFKDEMILILLSLDKLQLQMSSSFSWRWSDSTVWSFVFPLSS